jgi:hypothetical protein
VRPSGRNKPTCLNRLVFAGWLAPPEIALGFSCTLPDNATSATGLPIGPSSNGQSLKWITPARQFLAVKELVFFNTFRVTVGDEIQPDVVFEKGLKAREDQ